MVWSVETINLTKDIAASRRARQEARKQMCDDSRNALEKAKADLAQAGTERAEQAKADLMQRQADLKEMNAQIQAILEKAKADLAQAGTERAEQARTDVEQRYAVTRNRIAAIGEMLDKCRIERENASLAWQKLADMMFTKTEQPPTKTAVSPPEEKPASGAELKSTILDKTQLPDSVFNYLTAHPTGIRMTELEKEFDVPRIHMAKIIKNLLDSNKIEKREKLYFANQAV